MNVSPQTTASRTVAAANADRFRTWLEGAVGVEGSTDLFAEGDGCAELAAELDLGPDSMIFVPEAASGPSAWPQASQIVPYEGSLELAGGEVSLGEDVLVQTESLATAPYISVAVPTAFAIVDDIDLAALRTEVSGTRKSGSFPGYLTNPYVTVVNQQHWLAPLLPKTTTPARLFLSSAGELTDGPLGIEVSPDGTYSSPKAPPTHEDSVELARFLGATKVVRDLQLRTQQQVSVAGYGPLLATGGAQETRDRSRRDSIFVAFSDHQHYIVDLQTNRLDRVPQAIATMVEEVLSAHAANLEDQDSGHSQDNIVSVFKALGLGRLIPHSQGETL